MYKMEREKNRWHLLLWVEIEKLFVEKIILSNFLAICMKKFAVFIFWKLLFSYLFRYYDISHDKAASSEQSHHVKNSLVTNNVKFIPLTTQLPIFVTLQLNHIFEIWKKHVFLNLMTGKKVNGIRRKPLDWRNL